MRELTAHAGARRQYRPRLATTGGDLDGRLWGCPPTHSGRRDDVVTVQRPESRVTIAPRTGLLDPTGSVGAVIRL